MFRLFQQKLTDYSDHYLDGSRIGSRIGSLPTSGNHQYSARDIATRGVIIACTAIPVFLGAHLNDEKKTGCSDTTIAIASGLLGFVISHAVVIYPLIQKRWEMSRECIKLTDEIFQLVAQKSLNKYDCRQNIHDVVNLIQ